MLILTSPSLVPLTFASSPSGDAPPPHPTPIPPTPRHEREEPVAQVWDCDCGGDCRGRRGCPGGGLGGPEHAPATKVQGKMATSSTYERVVSVGIGFFFYRSYGEPVKLGNSCRILKSELNAAVFALLACVHKIGPI